MSVISKCRLCIIFINNIKMTLGLVSIVFWSCTMLYYMLMFCFTVNNLFKELN